VTGEGAWREIMKTMKSKKQEFIKEGSDTEARRYDLALRDLRGIVDPKHTAIYLGNMEKEAFRAKLVEPLQLYQALSDVVKRMQTTKQLEQKHLLQLETTVNDLSSKVIVLSNHTEQVKTSFDAITKSSDVALSEAYSDLKVKKKLKAAAPITIFKERGLVRHNSYLELVEEHVLEKVDIDPSKTGFWNYNCYSCFSCVSSKETAMNLLFLHKISFMFITTKNPDIVSLKLVYTASQRGHERDEDLLHDIDLSISDLERPPINASTAAAPKFFTFEYDPFGDRVPIDRSVVFNFHRTALAAMMTKLPRPRHGNTLDQVAMTDHGFGKVLGKF